jgi:hypothetical protein
MLNCIFLILEINVFYKITIKKILITFPKSAVIILNQLNKNKFL